MKLISLGKKLEYMSVTYTTIPRGILTREIALLSTPFCSQMPLENLLKDASVTSESERITIAQKALSNRSELVVVFDDYFKANPHVQGHCLRVRGPCC